MSENFENKKALVEVIKEQAQKASGIFLVNYKGITVAADTDLRASFRKEGVEYKVYKNRLMKRAFEDLGIKFDEEACEGSTAVAFAMEDGLAPARIVTSKQETLKDFAFKGAFIEGKLYDAQGVKVIASSPPKEVLLGQLVAMLQMPIKKLAITVNEIAKK